MTARPRTAAALAGFGLVTLLAFRDGGYFSDTWLPAGLGLACVGGLALVLGGRPSVGRAELVFVALVAALVAWIALSAAWSLDPDESLREAGRASLYLVGAVALLLVARPVSVVGLVAGVVAGIGVVVAYALGDRALEAGPPRVDPYEGTLLFEPVGYANALAILAVVGLLLALGLALVASRPAARAAAASVGPMLLAALALTRSNGAWLALAAGLAIVLVLTPASTRDRLVGTLLVVGLWGGLAAARADALGDGRLVLACALLGGAAAVSSLAVGRIGRVSRPLLVGAGAAALIVAIVVAWRAAPSPSTLAGNDRPRYWRVALSEYEDNAALGSGAGTFALFWLTERPVESNARDAHSLYLETLAELGPVGLVLVAAALSTPFAAARRRASPLVPATLGAYGAFVVHAGVDWDWEMPVVTLTGLACAAAALALSRPGRRDSPSFEPLSRFSDQPTSVRQEPPTPRRISACTASFVSPSPSSSEPCSSSP